MLVPRPPTRAAASFIARTPQQQQHALASLAPPPRKPAQQPAGTPRIPEVMNTPAPEPQLRGRKRPKRPQPLPAPRRSHVANARVKGVPAAAAAAAAPQRRQLWRIKSKKVKPAPMRVLRALGRLVQKRGAAAAAAAAPAMCAPLSPSMSLMARSMSLRVAAKGALSFVALSTVPAAKCSSRPRSSSSASSSFSSCFSTASSSGSRPSSASSSCAALPVSRPSSSCGGSVRSRRPPIAAAAAASASKQADDGDCLATIRIAFENAPAVMRDTVVAIVAARRGYEIVPELEKARAHVLYSSIVWNRFGAVPAFASGRSKAITMIPGLRYAVGKGNLCCCVWNAFRAAMPPPQRGGDAAAAEDEMSFVPLSFLLPIDRVAFVQYCEGVEAECARRKSQRPPFWILKPENGSCGADVRLCESSKEVLDLTRRDTTLYVVQEYLADTLLLPGGRQLDAEEEAAGAANPAQQTEKLFKFDLRVYVLVTSLRPVLRFHLFREGYCRVAGSPYVSPTSAASTRATIGDRSCHVTNIVVGRESGTQFVESAQLPETAPGESVADGGDVFQEQPNCTKRSISLAFHQLQQRFGRARFDPELVWARITRAVEHTLKTVQPFLFQAAAADSPSSTATQHLLGYDVMLVHRDSDSGAGQPCVRILEINSRPSFMGEDRLGRIIGSALADHVLAVAEAAVRSARYTLTSNGESAAREVAVAQSSAAAAAAASDAHQLNLRFVVFDEAAALPQTTSASSEAFRAAHARITKLREWFDFLRDQDAFSAESGAASLSLTAFSRLVRALRVCGPLPTQQKIMLMMCEARRFSRVVPSIDSSGNNGSGDSSSSGGLSFVDFFHFMLSVGRKLIGGDGADRAMPDHELLPKLIELLEQHKVFT